MVLRQPRGTRSCSPGGMRQPAGAGEEISITIGNHGGTRMRAEAQGILIGWASRDITPDKTANVVGQLHVRLSEYVNDPLTTTALAMESADRGQQAIMVSVDAAVVEESVWMECIDILERELEGFDTSRLFINATHTHNSAAQVPLVRYPPQAEDVMTPEAYAEIMVRGICEAAAEAWRTREPGAVSWGCGQAVVGFNRRMTYLDGASAMYGNTDDPQFSHLEGYEDHGVDLLFTYDADKNPTGMIVNLACPSQVSEVDPFISADFWHDARCEIRRRHGDGLFVLPQCSAAGDQSPHLMTKKAAEERMLVLKGFMKPGEDKGKAERIEIGRRIAAAVDEVLPLAGKDIRDTVVFEHEVVDLELPRRSITVEQFEFAKETLRIHEEKLANCDPDPTSHEYSYSYVLAGRLKRAMDWYKQQETQEVLPITIHIIRLGDIAFATNRFELFLDYGIRIKARSKATQTFVIQLVGEGSYLPSERAVRSQSYGTGIENSIVSPEGAQLLVNESVRTINDLFDGILHDHRKNK